MLIIGEKLNSSVPKTLEALNSHNEKYLTETIKRQAQCGAQYLDINTALTRDKETENMLWVIKLALENSPCGIMIDSPEPQVILDCMPALEGRRAIVNSITLDDKYDALISAIKETQAGVVCLPIKGRAIPETAQERVENAALLINKLRSAKIEDDKIYIDILAEAVATNGEAAKTALETLRLIREQFPRIHTVCGLSNISFGLPLRAKLNAAFLTMAMQNGMDSVIADPTSETVMDAVYIAQAMLGEDEYCIEFINYIREKD